MPLGLKPGERLVSGRNIDPESYQQFLRAKRLVRARARRVPAAIKILEPLVARYCAWPGAVGGCLWSNTELQPQRLQGRVAPCRRGVSSQSGNGRAAGDPIGSQSRGRISGSGPRAVRPREIPAGSGAFFQGARLGPQQPRFCDSIQQSACECVAPERKPWR